jgi:cytochrome o ubiquinol oxidase operon protein cyoD
MSHASPPSRHGNRSAFKRCLRAFGIGITAVLFGIIVGLALNPPRATVPASHARPASLGQQEEYRHELHTYIWGYIIALVLTLVPFALVHWSGMAASGLYLAIGAFAIVQAIVHFRCFLHIDPPRQNTDDLHLILFSTLLLLFMVGGTIWILANLATRMH